MTFLCRSQMQKNIAEKMAMELLFWQKPWLSKPRFVSYHPNHMKKSFHRLYFSYHPNHIKKTFHRLYSVLNRYKNNSKYHKYMQTLYIMMQFLGAVPVSLFFKTNLKEIAILSKTQFIIQQHNIAMTLSFIQSVACFNIDLFQINPLP